MLPLPCFTMWMVCSGSCAVGVLYVTKIIYLSVSKLQQFLPRASRLDMSCGKLQWELLQGFFNNSFALAKLPIFFIKTLFMR